MEPRPIASRQSCTRSGCFQSRVHWPALTLRHRHPVVRRHRVRFTDDEALSYPPRRHRRRHRRRDSADSARGTGGMRREWGRKDRETRATKRVLKFRRLHLVHSSAVAAQQTVAVTALILEFSLSLTRFHPPLPLSFPPVFSFFYCLSSRSRRASGFPTKNLCPSRYWILMRSTFRFYTRIIKYFITKYFCTQNSARFLYIRFSIPIRSG